MKIVRLNDTTQSEIIALLTTTLRSGGLVIFPTETTYGAGVDATNMLAVQKLLQYKSRREGKPLSIAVANQAMAEQYALLNEQAQTLYTQFLPGPVTVVSHARKTLAPGVASEFGTVGVRIPAYPFLLEFLAQYQKPITATSANASGKKRPYSIEDVFAGLSEKQKSLIDLVIDAGQLPENPPSTVIDTTLSTPVTLRKGTVVIEQAETDHYQLISKSSEETARIAGTLLLKHWDAVHKTGIVIGLDGPLGAGKTIFAKGIAEFLKIDEDITSPTYTYMEEYEFRRHMTTGMFYHLDLWKIDSPEILERLSLETVLNPDAVIVIEWWSQVADYLKPLIKAHAMPYIHVQLAETESTDDTSRLISIQDTDA